MTIPVRTDDTASAECPHCDQRLDEIVAVPLQARLGKRFGYVCPHCNKLLSVSHRKGFWMG